VQLPMQVAMFRPAVGGELTQYVNETWAGIS
jgi:hypothetical protein